MVSFWKLVYQNKNHSDSFQVWKKLLPSKFLSSFALTAQPHQKIANRSNKQINDTDKGAYSQIHLFVFSGFNVEDNCKYIEMYAFADKNTLLCAVERKTDH